MIHFIDDECQIFQNFVETLDLTISIFSRRLTQIFEPENEAKKMIKNAVSRGPRKDEKFAGISGLCIANTYTN